MQSQRCRVALNIAYHCNKCGAPVDFNVRTCPVAVPGWSFFVIYIFFFSRRIRHYSSLLSRPWCVRSFLLTINQSWGSAAVAIDGVLPDWCGNCCCVSWRLRRTKLFTPRTPCRTECRGWPCSRVWTLDCPFALPHWSSRTLSTSSWRLKE